VNRRRIAIVVAALSILGAGVLAQEGGLARVRELFISARYAEAADALESTPAGGVERRWWEARLTVDPERFQELALAVAQDDAAAESLRREVRLARAREHFAAGRYQSAEGLLRPLAEQRDPFDAPARLWWGMSLQATGEARAATKAFESISASESEYGIAQALLADLSLRAQRPRRAREHAEAALRADDAVGAIALGVLEQLARAEGDPDALRSVTNRLGDDYPKSVELTWARSAAPSGIDVQDDSDIVVAEESSGPRRTFALQYGAFHDRALGLRKIRQLENDVADLRLEVDREQSPPLYRVLGGSFGTRSQAERARDAMAGRGIDAFILSPDR
jgi:tetratricopeptide (TPR) repeat protein